MKKIMFNDKYGLTQAVLVGGKTQTRRIVTLTMRKQGPNGLEEVFPDRVYQQADKWKFDYDGYTFPLPKRDYPRYKVGEVVAVAQSYSDCGNFPDECKYDEDGYPIMPKNSGYFNKMFVRADLMPYRIKIINVRIERLQDISEEDCLAEGIYKGQCGNIDTHFMDAYYYEGEIQPYCTAREAYAALFDKVSGKGTWESNPWVFVYEFELVK